MHPGLRSNYLRLPPRAPQTPGRPQPQGSPPLLVTPRSVALRLTSLSLSPVRDKRLGFRPPIPPPRRLPPPPSPTTSAVAVPAAVCAPPPTTSSAAGHLHGAPAPADRRRRPRPPRLAAAQLVPGLQLASAQVCTLRVTLICVESSAGHFDGVCAITLNCLGGSVL